MPAAREPTGTAPVPTVDVEHLPYEQLTALDTPQTDAQVRTYSVRVPPDLSHTVTMLL